MQAGVSSIARMVHGTPHAGDMAFVDIAPEVTEETLKSIQEFVNSLKPGQ